MSFTTFRFNLIHKNVYAYAVEQNFDQYFGLYTTVSLNNLLLAF